jgi:hypothetical protein
VALRHDGLGAPDDVALRRDGHGASEAVAWSRVGLDGLAATAPTRGAWQWLFMAGPSVWYMIENMCSMGPSWPRHQKTMNFSLSRASDQSEIIQYSKYPRLQSARTPLETLVNYPASIFSTTSRYTNIYATSNICKWRPDSASKKIKNRRGLAARAIS